VTTSGKRTSKVKHVGSCQFLLVLACCFCSNAQAGQLESLDQADSANTGVYHVAFSAAGGAQGRRIGEAYFSRARLNPHVLAQATTGQTSDVPRAAPVPTFDCTDVIGKVFVDNNANGYQDEDESGLASVKLVTATGLEARTDPHGRFHITCARVPNADRGSNFVIKLDARSLPAGYRLTTENPRVQRVTPGKILKFNFGAAALRRVRLDLADEVFAHDSTQIREHWLPQVGELIDRLAETPSRLCLVYVAQEEEISLVKDRVQAIRNEIERRWKDRDCCYKLDIETRIIRRSS
jgi:hypothetical protein